MRNVIYNISLCRSYLIRPVVSNTSYEMRNFRRRECEFDLEHRRRWEELQRVATGTGMGNWELVRGNGR